MCVVVFYMEKEVIPITEFFDDEPIITPSGMYANYQPDMNTKRERLCALGVKTAVITLLKKEELVEFVRGAEVFHHVLGKSGKTPCYIIEGNCLLVLAPIRGNSAAIIEELACLGIKNVVALSGCGRLKDSLDESGLIVMERAIRDEGASYHYLAPSVFVETDPAVTAVIEKVLTTRELKYTRGTAWTTDAIYRETKKRANRRREQGAICVDLEAASFAAAAKRLGVRFGQVFYFGDILYENGDWRLVQESLHRRGIKVSLLPVAIEIAKNL